MTELKLGFSFESDSIPARGERIARWVEDHMRETGVSVGELAFRIGADKRDVRRLLSGRSCGPRLNDSLEATFAHDFMDAVAAPLLGGDRLTVLEREIASERAKIAALDARLDRETTAWNARAASRGGVLRLLPQEGRGWNT